MFSSFGSFSRAWGRAIQVLVFALGIAMLLAGSAMAQQTCGGKKFKGRKKVDTVKDPNSNKVFEVFCVDDLYFKGEMICGNERICVSKCVFDFAGNRDFGIPGPGGGWEEYIWYNWDRSTCNLTVGETARRRGETPRQQADRIRQTLLDRGCDFNCYSWKPAGNKADGQGGITLVVGSGGTIVEETFIFEDEIEFAFEGGNPYLIEDPIMHTDESQGQVRAGDAAMFEDFQDGVMDSRYSALAGSGPVTVANGALNFDIVNAGDGIEIDVYDLNAMCLVLQDMNVGTFAVGNGFGIEMLFDDGSWIDVQLYQENSIRVKIKESGTNTEVVRKVDGVDLDEVDSIQVDWVPSDTALDRIEIEIKTKDGRRVVKKVRSGLKHEDGRTTAYRIRGLDITQDPPISIGAIMFSDEHWDVPADFYLGTDVDTVSVAGPSLCMVNVGETHLLDVLATGVRSLGIPEREITFQSLDATGGAVAFTNPLGVRTYDYSETTLITDELGFATAEFTAVKPGPVSIGVFVEGELMYTHTLEVVAEPDIMHVPDSRRHMKK